MSRGNNKFIQIINEISVRLYSRLSRTNYLYLVLCAGIILCLFNWFNCTNKYAINILCWDQWDFYDPFFYHFSFIDTFTYQYGPHRQGLGGLLTWFVDFLSGWNTRYISFTIMWMMIITAIVYYLLQRKLFFGQSAFNLLVFIIALTPTQIYMHTPNISHGPMPALLLSLFSASLLIKNYVWRNVLLLIINFNLIFCGFGMFIGFITPLLLAGELYWSIKKKNILYIKIALYSLTISLLSDYLFFVDYHFEPAVHDFKFPAEKPWRYLIFMTVGYSYFWGISTLNFLNYFIGGLSILLLMYVMSVHMRMIINNSFDPLNDEIILSKIILSLIAFSLLFLFNTAIGRISLGYATVQAPRYMPYLVPSLIALFLHIKSLKIEQRSVLLLLFTVIFIPVTILGAGAHLDYMRSNAENKMAWKNAWLKYESIEMADSISHFEIYPNAADADIKEKLLFLKKNKLNLYSKH